MTSPGPPDDTWDLVVVGAGPAGASTALAALAEDPALRVLLLDRAEFPRDKCCGDGIAPHALDVLRGLGVEGAAGWTPLDRLEIARGEQAVAGRMARAAYVVPRAAFDAGLVEAALAAGAVVRRHKVAEVVGDAHGVTVDGVLRARVVVGADGAHSRVRTAAGLPRSTRRALALRGYAPTPVGRRARQVIRFGERRQPSYAWSFDRGDGLCNVGYGELVDDRVERPGPSRELMLEQLECLLPGASDGGTGWRGHHLPLSGWRWQQPDGRLMLAGDAAGLVNPMTGEGIYYAVATGALAGRTAARALRENAGADVGARHRRGVRRLLARHLRHTWTASRLIARPAVLDAGLRAAARDPRAFDDLVEIGLGRGRVTPRLAVGLAGSLLTARSPEGARA